jgi:hypothetical protein
MSGMTPDADIRWQLFDVGFVPIAAVGTCYSITS